MESHDRDPPEIFRGHFDECLKHFGRCLSDHFGRGTTEIAQAKKLVADFCGCKPETVTNWFRPKSGLPVGEVGLKLMFYLDLMGYKVIELENMPKVRRNFAELIAFGVVASEQIPEIVGFSRTMRFYEVLRGDTNASEEKDQRMWDEWRKKKGELAQAREKAFELSRVDISHSKSTRQEASTIESAVISLMQGLLALLESEVLNGGLKSLGQSGVKTILRLSARLSTLSSQLMMPTEEKGGIP